MCAGPLRFAEATSVSLMLREYRMRIALMSMLQPLTKKLNGRPLFFSSENFYFHVFSHSVFCFLVLMFNEALCKYSFILFLMLCAPITRASLARNVESPLSK